MAIYTLNLEDPSEAAELDVFLRSKDWGADLVANRQGERIVSWTFEVRSQVQGISELFMPLRPLVRIDIRRAPTMSKKLSMRRAEPDTERYRALANETSDSQATYKYLNSKVRPGFTPRQIKEDDFTVVGWYNLVLDQEAAKEVKSHKGIDSDTFRVQDKMKKHRALDTRDSMQAADPPRDGTFKTARQLHPRAAQWEKQAKADEALVMDSQYKQVWLWILIG